MKLKNGLCDDNTAQPSQIQLLLNVFLQNFNENIKI